MLRHIPGVKVRSGQVESGQRLSVVPTEILFFFFFPLLLIKRTCCQYPSEVPSSCADKTWRYERAICERQREEGLAHA